MKCEAAQELVVGGFTDPQGARVGLGALLVGYFEGDDFVFAGKVGTGFDTKLLLDLRARLDALEIAQAAVHEGATGLPRLRAHWVRPEIVVQVAFIEWTVHGKLRHPRLLGVRDRQGARARSCREHAVITASREGAVPRRRDHQGRARGLLRGGRAGHAAAPRGRPDDDGALPRRHRREGFLQKDVVEGLPGVARARRGAEEGRHRPPSARRRRAVAALAGEPEQHHAARLDVARAATSYHPDICVFDLDPSEDEPGVLRAAALALRDLLEELGLPSWVKTSGSKGFHIVVPLDGKADFGEVGALRARGRPRAGRSATRRTSRRSSARPIAAAASCRHRAQRAQRHVRRGLRGAREAGRAGVGAVHVGGGRARRGRARTFTLRTMAERLDAVGDLWAAMRENRRYSIVRRTTQTHNRIAVD